MLNYTFITPKQATTEVDRYITWPGQACAYKIGEMHIKKLRKHAQDVLGKSIKHYLSYFNVASNILVLLTHDTPNSFIIFTGEKFDIQAFHWQVMRLGFVPLEVLEDSIEHWIQSEVSGAMATASYCSHERAVILLSLLTMALMGQGFG